MITCITHIYCIRSRGSKLAHLYGLPKTHKEQLAVRPILSATNTYNYSLAKWQKLKPLLCNQYTVIYTFHFADEVRGLEIKNGEVLVSQDVISLFTNIPLEEFSWKSLCPRLVQRDTQLEPLSNGLNQPPLSSYKKKLFQFDSALYKQIDGEAMGSPLGPLLTNIFMSSIEENLKQHGQLPRYYRRYVDKNSSISQEYFNNISSSVNDERI